MDSGGCCSRKLAGGGKDKTIINRIMLRFRPIAPKPVTGGSGSGESPPENNKETVKKGRAKRKYVRAKKNNQCKKKIKDGSDRKVLTQPVLPQISCRRESTTGESFGNLDFPVIYPVQQLPILLNLDNKAEKIDSGSSDKSDRTADIPSESWVTVECVTDGCMDGGELGCTDEERIKSLEADTCPGFVSDGVNRVRWTNLAYRRMVSAGEGGESAAETVVQLAVKVELPTWHPSFACRVRVQYTWRKQKCCSQTVPCDVWRMDFGGFAWRLDLKAALSLGR